MVTTNRRKSLYQRRAESYSAHYALRVNPGHKNASPAAVKSNLHGASSAPARWLETLK
jgi:hypothetical protein